MTIFIPLGIIASIFQLVILREFSFSIAKNELAFVVAAGFWIIFCSLGSIVKSSKKLQEFPLCILASLSFFLSICLIHLAKSLIGLKYYEATSLIFVLFLSIILIGPAAFVIGLTFRHLVQEYIKNSRPQKSVYAKFFAFEAIGFFLGGASFTLYFIDYTNPLIFSLLPLILLPGIKNHRKKILPVCFIIIITIISILSFNSILKKEFAHANIKANLGSGYGPVIVTDKADATTIFSGGSSLATSEDTVLNEEFIHMSISAAEPSVNKDILFIGAALFGQAEEIAKYKLNSLDCLQIDPLISKLAEYKLSSGMKNKINFITNDPRLYLKNTHKQYDVILMNMPAPTNLALNRYFTEEFFKLIIGRLKLKGIFSFTIPSKREILSPQFIKFNSSIINAVDKVFAYKLIIPSDAMIIIASDKQKINDYDLLDNFTKTKPTTLFFTIYHFKDYLAPAMRNYTQNLLDKTISPNTDLNPSGFLNYLILEQIKFYPDLKIDFKKMRSNTILFLLFFGLVIIILSYLSKKASCLLSILTIGFSSISFSSIIFVLFQLYCGALFWKLGLLIALFMAGLSIGIFLINAIKSYRANLLSEIYLFWMIAIFTLFSNLKIIGSSNYAELIFYLYALICGFLTGSSYPLLAQNLLKNKFDDKGIAMTIYSVDLIGAFLGTITSGILLIPFLGISYSLLTLIFLNAIFALKNLRN
jgi:predicted membrane-bound spermidine synthase